MNDFNVWLSIAEALRVAEYAWGIAVVNCSPEYWQKALMRWLRYTAVGWRLTGPNGDTVYQ